LCDLCVKKRCRHLTAAAGLEKPVCHPPAPLTECHEHHQGRVMDRLKDKVAVITGAASGIGLGTTELFVAEGAKVIAADIQEDKGKALERRFNGQVKFVRCDVMLESDIKAAIDAAVATYGGLDILFNNAGAGGSPNTIEDMTGEAWDRSMDLLLRSVA